MLPPGSLGVWGRGHRGLWAHHSLLPGQSQLSLSTHYCDTPHLNARYQYLPTITIISPFFPFLNPFFRFISFIFLLFCSYLFFSFLCSYAFPSIQAVGEKRTKRSAYFTQRKMKHVTPADLMWWDGMGCDMMGCYRVWSDLIWYKCYVIQIIREVTS